MDKPTTLARRSDLADYEGLRRHPKVGRVLDLPYDYVMFDFWDDAFTQIFDKTKAYHADPILRAKATELRAEEEALVKPLYDRAADTNFVTSWGFTLNQRSYEMPLLRKERFIETQYFKVEAIPMKCEINAVFKGLTEQRRDAFEQVIENWKKWDAESLGKVVTVSPVEYTGDSGAIHVHFAHEFEDSLAAFIVMQNAKRLATRVVELVY